MLRPAKQLAAVAAVTLVLSGLGLSGAGAQTSGDWPSYLDNAARTGFNGAETVITPSTAPHLTLKWTDHAGGPISAEPIQVNGVVYYGSWDGHERAVSAATGKQLWSSVSLGQSVNRGCNNPLRVGVANTATVATITVNGTATQAVFVGGGNGAFYALRASTGAVIWKTQLGAPPAHFLWSSPVLYNGSIYEGLSSLIDCPLVRGGIVRLNATTGKIQNELFTVPAGCTGGSVWGSPAVDTATGNVYFATGNPGRCSTTEKLAIAVIKTDRFLGHVSSWQVPKRELVNDSDFGSTPTLFNAMISGVIRLMVGVQNKNGLYFAIRRNAIVSGPVWTKRMAVGGDMPRKGRSDISPSAYNGVYLFVGSEETQVGGVSCIGTIRKVRPASGNTVWATCLRSGPVLGAVTAVPGVAFVAAGNTVYALGSIAGNILWTFRDTSSASQFWGAAAVSNGQLYIGNMDGNLYAFGP